jgi:hypothetical protein
VAEKTDGDISTISDDNEPCAKGHGLKLFNEELTAIPVKLLFRGNLHLKISPIFV